MPNKPLRLVVCGASGRMGSRVAALAAADKRFALAACLSRGNSARFAQADVVIDFSAPEASLLFAAEAARAKKAIVIGTTGFSSPQLARLKDFAKRIPVFLSPNFSPGVHLLFHLSALAARLLKDYDASVSEVHHRHKKDSPSGTALRLVSEIVKSRRNLAAVPSVSQRLGDVVGEHTLTLAGPFERLELTHKAHSRDLFARGALEAALWVRGRKPGLYDVPDMLELA